ncbi:MAG TPA: hypothetical protein VMG12_09160 [Polyangiaceae bacterium]|nr:hypothetical protein [Polyangiaceae bacterium]
MALASACGSPSEGHTDDANDANDANDAGLPPPEPRPDAGRPTDDCFVERDGPCDRVSGCGCAPEEACRIAADAPGVAACGPLASDAQMPYGACADSATCPKGHSCVDGVCKQHCSTADDCGWADARCLPVTVLGEPLEGVGYCARDCDLVLPPSPGARSCGPEAQCVPAGTGADCVRRAGDGEAGDACSATSECAAGHRCSSESRCERWCRVDGDGCGGGLECVGIDTIGSVAGSGSAGPAGTSELGTCTCVRAEGAACNLVTGCGCDEGQTCGYVGTGPGCREIDAFPAEPYAACTYDRDCPAAHACLAGLCQQQCNTAADCGWSGSACLAVFDPETDQPIPGFNFCASACDPLSPQEPADGFRPCGDGQNCFPLDAAGVCFRATAALGEGEPCDAGACAPGLFCSPYDRCERWCEVGAGGCAAGLDCEGFEPAVLSSGAAGARELGRCVCRPADGALCDPSNDCGCSAGSTCDYFVDERLFACRPLAPFPVPPNGGCDEDIDCPALHGCFDGVCKQLCQEPADCDNPGSRCVAANYDGVEFPGWSFCTVACDLVSPPVPPAGYESCGYGSQCIMTATGPDCVAPAGTGFAGVPCTSARDCEPGNFCGAGGLCQRWCALDEPEWCGVAATCFGFDPALVHEGREYGRCACAPQNGERCDPLADCGCDPGLTCRLQSGPEPVGCFLPASSLAEPYSNCDSGSDCPVSHDCIHGVCKQLCAAPEHCGGEGTRCTPLGLELDDTTLDVSYCAHECDPVSPTTPVAGASAACGADAQCVPFESGFDCARGGSGALGDACDAVDACAPGLFCSGDGRCSAWCHVGLGECLPGTTCVASSDPTASGAGVGRCAPCSDDCGEPNGSCEDGGPDSVAALCPAGSDCTDCGVH